MNGLPLLHRLEGQPVVVIGEGTMAQAKRRLIERAGGTCVTEAMAHRARLGFVALDDAREAEAAALRLKRHGLLVNVADRPDLCDVTLPSVLERGPITIAVATGALRQGSQNIYAWRWSASYPPGLAIWRSAWARPERSCAFDGRTAMHGAGR